MAKLNLDTALLDDARIQNLSDADFRAYIKALAAEAACGRERFNTCALRFALGVSTPELWGIVNRLEAVGLCDAQPGVGLHHPEPLAHTPINDALKSGTWPSNFKPIGPDKRAQRSRSSSTDAAA